MAVETDVKKTNTRRGWLVVFVLMFAGISILLNQYKVPTMIGAFMQDFKLFGQLGMINWLMSVYGIASIILAIPTASLINRYGPKTMGLVGLGGSAIGVFIGATAYSYAQLLVGRIVEGMGFAMISVVSATLIAMHFPREKAGAPMSIWNNFYPIGSTLGYVLAFPVIIATGNLDFKTHQITPFGWHSWWLFGGIIAVIAFILFAIAVNVPKSDPAGTAESHGMGGKAKNVVRDGIKVKRIWMLSIAAMFMFFCSISFLTQVPHYLTTTHPEIWANDAAAGGMSSLGFIMAIPGSLISALLLKKFTSLKARQNMIIVGAILNVMYIFSYFVPISSNPGDLQIPFRIFLILDGMVTGYVAAVLWSSVPLTMPVKATIPVGMAIVSASTSIAALVAPPIVGYVVQTGVDSYNWNLAAVPITIYAILAIIFAVIYKKSSTPVYEESGSN
ncbi:MAG: MFS transporter [Clostridiales bacterium]|nr:MFS transporter [Clostridiales bacterium]